MKHTKWNVSKMQKSSPNPIIKFGELNFSISVKGCAEMKELFQCSQDLREVLLKEQILQSAFTADEDTAMSFFMLSALRRHNYNATGLKESDYCGLSDE